MIGLNLLDVTYYALTVIEWLLFAAIVVSAAIACRGFWLAHQADERDLRTFAHPSNVTVHPRPRVFDWADDEASA